jgi:2-succinyl-5-enolpyruvyl-6-hydroxy-3-cyclohexene-1-carboxylate synthase
MVGSSSGTPQPCDVQATFCATLVDEWIRSGVRHAVIAPGSRSTPMAVALVDRPDIDIHIVHDERVAGFVALGLGLGGTPPLLLCTSGTAAANFLPAVVEAGLSEIPMVVLTADRPPELRGVGAPQTIDQIELYGAHVRWFHDAEVARAEAANDWRSLAQQTVAHSAHGPVQLNLGFREPLLGTPHELPPTIAPLDRRVETQASPVPEALACARGVILVGGRSGVSEDDVRALGAATGWPLIADPISGLRHLEGVVTSAESILRHAPFGNGHLPDAVVRIGRPSTSKTLSQWVDRAVADGAILVQVGGPGVIDPGQNVAARCSIDDVIDRCDEVRQDPTWKADWEAAERAADDAILAMLAKLDQTGELTEPGVARVVTDHLPDTVELVVSSSMPVRDHEWFGGANARAHANRGANGIDGVTSTALGVALRRGSTAVLIGDLAFVHDSNALAGLAARNTDLRVVVVDNDGGGIFSFLPQAAQLTSERFEQLFGTPHGTDVLALAAAHGLAAVEVSSAEQLAVQLAQPGPWVTRIASTRRRNVEVHAALHDAVAAALG